MVILIAEDKNVGVRLVQREDSTHPYHVEIRSKDGALLDAQPFRTKRRARGYYARALKAVRDTVSETPRRIDAFPRKRTR